MKIRKDMIFAVLTTFCLCALMFAVIPIRSGLPYDPWTDIDDNGKIDMKDIGNVAAQFMTSGDSTKNVNVTNWPESQITAPKTIHFGPTFFNMTPGSSHFDNYDTSGYCQIVISSWADSTGVKVDVREYTENPYGPTGTLDSWFIAPAFAREGSSRTYPIRTSRVLVAITNTYLVNVSVSLDVVLTTAPYFDAMPQYRSNNANFNISWTPGGCSSGGYPLFAWGFSKMFFSFTVTNVSREGSWSPVSLYMESINWEDGGIEGYHYYEPIGKNYYNKTLSGWSYGSKIQIGGAGPIDVKGPYFFFSPGIEGFEAIAPSGWITLSVYYYLRTD